MAPFCCSFSPLPISTSVSKFITEQPYLSMIETKCSTIKDLQIIQAQIIKTGLIKDTIAASRLLAFAATSPAADINYAYMVFSRMPNPNVFSWNTMIRGFSRSSNPQMAVFLFIDMLVNSVVEPERLTYPSLFKAYAELGLAHDGAQLHGRIVKLGLQSDVYIRNTMILMYANCGFFDEAFKLFGDGKDMDVVAWNSMIISLAKYEEIHNARTLFDKMPERNTVSWNSMISGYVRVGKWVEALGLFRKMQEEKRKPSEFTLVSLLNASAHLGASRQGEWIHDYIRKNNVELNTVLITAIINMYCKCGSIERARQVFETAPLKGLSCWNSMIMGLAIHGHKDAAIELFTRLESSGLVPDCVSFVGVLVACTHSRLVDEAKYYFSLMTEKYNIQPTIKHYGCMVDLLGRAGLLEEAEVLIRSMTMSPDAVIWGSLLSSSRSYGNIEIGRRASRKLLEMDENESAAHVLLSNVYAASGHFEKAVQERLLMKKGLMEKQPGCSLIEVNGEVHEFVAGGRLHPQIQEINSLLYN